VQPPDGKQHAPSVTVGHGGVEPVLGVQFVPLPWYVPPNCWQFAAVVTEQPVGRQHAPMAGAGQVVTAQAVPSPWYVPPICWQCAADPTKHPPVGRQHAPVGVVGQPVAVQAVPLPW
jgi:hypothetical protein